MVVAGTIMMGTKIVVLLLLRHILEGMDVACSIRRGTKLEATRRVADVADAAVAEGMFGRLEKSWKMRVYW